LYTERLEVATLVLNSTDCDALLDHEALMRVLGDAHRALSSGEAAQPRAPVIASVEPLGRSLVPMLASYAGLFVIKLLVDAPLERDHGRPAQRSSLALFDAETAECLALIDGRSLTRRRTAAASALATAALARPGGGVLGLVGAGVLAEEHVHSHLALGYDRVLVWSRTPRTADDFAERLPESIDVEIAKTPRDVVGQADAVCTLTPAVEPLIFAEDLRPGLHINAVGSPPRPGFREVSADVIGAASFVCVDSREVAERESGNVRGALAQGQIRTTDLVELGDVLSGRRDGRSLEEDITFYNSVGIGLQDLAAAALLLGRAIEERAGISVSLRP
jgi:ornithine cyclodeaminase/alanine dehydrogenase-like protein (mu-crystallin family)